MTIYSLDVLLSHLEPVCCSMSGSNCCFLTYIQISQEAGQVVLYSHFFKNFLQFVVIHTVKGFDVVNKAEVDFFWNSLAFSMIQRMLAIWSLVLLPFLNPAWTSGSSQFTYGWSLGLENFEHCFTSMWDECNCAAVWRIRCLDSIIDSMDINFSKLQELVKDRGAWNAAVHEVT